MARIGGVGLEGLDGGAYTPVACGLHDQLEALATLGAPCEVEYSDGGVRATVSGRIRDVYARDGVEYLQVDGAAPIRLDRLSLVRAPGTVVRFPAAESPPLPTSGSPGAP